MSARRPFIAYWIGEEPTGPGHSPTLADIPPALVDSLDLIIINYVTVVKGDLDFSVVTKHNDQKTIMSWIAGIRARQKNFSNKTKFSLGIESDAFYKQAPGSFAAKVAAAARDWAMDGIDIDYEPPSTSLDILSVVQAIRQALPARFVLTTPIYSPWTESDEMKALLRRYAALFNYVTTMDYTPYPDYDETISRLKGYAAAIGGEDPYSKLVPGVSCMLFNSDDDYTPLDDAKKLCGFQSEKGTRPGMMLYTLTYDTPGHAGGNYPYKPFTYGDTIAAQLRPA